SYASLWLMAPGESIIAPEVAWGASAYAYWSGTSMSTPEVAGAVALLEAAWPILKTNGGAPAILFASATDLGAKGVDSTFGNGLLNIAKAFQPVGTLSVIGVNGQPSPVASQPGSVVASGALGALPGVRSVLSSYTTFDAYRRNFTSNLSGMVTAASTSSNSQPFVAAPTRTTTNAVRGGQFTVVGSDTPWLEQDAFGGDASYDFNDRMLGHRDRSVSLLEFAGTNGDYLAVGHGVSSTLSFAQAAWGANSLAAEQASGLGVNSALVDLAQGGYSAAAGAAGFGRLRVAMTWTSSAPPIGSAFAADRSRSDATAIAVALTARITPRWSLGATLSSLKEDNALLGTTYVGDGLVSLGARHDSSQAGISSVFDVGGRRSILAEATVVDVSGASMTSGLVRDVSPLQARAFGLSFIQGDALMSGDSLSISVRKPLRVVSGDARIAVTSVDAEGNPVMSFTPVSLAPSGNETDLTLGYASPARDQISWRGLVSLRDDADNQAGRKDVAFRLGLNWGF
ncbi:MAG: S8 family serine peptidase, partial [Caulobacterales bacterium]